VNITREKNTMVPSSSRTGTKAPHTPASTTSLSLSRSSSQEEEARLFFTAQSRSWES
jgi:hypothetical protein